MLYGIFDGCDGLCELRGSCTSVEKSANEKSETTGLQRGIGEKYAPH